MSTNPKAKAWDQIGGLFWDQGRKSARPNESELREFCKRIHPTQRVCVVGASTKELCEEIVRLGASLTVLDFSGKMLEDLGKVLPTVELHQVDITKDVPIGLNSRYDFVLSDRLINRFDMEEAIQGVSGFKALLSRGGVLRTSVKLGLYPMDRTMLKAAENLAIGNAFWDAQTQTIDFSKAGKALEAGLLPHGSIDESLLREWYRGRGREKRFSDMEVNGLLAEAPFDLVRSYQLQGSKDTKMYTAVNS